jgi:hypothetical protein
MASLKKNKNETKQTNLLEVGHPFPQPMKVEIITNIVLIHLNEKLMSFKVAKPLNPPRPGFAVTSVINF